MSEGFEPFPVHSLVPKRETGAERFLARFPQFDGRGVVIAILDTGVDPGAPGLDVTTERERKILDLVDTSGSGDVDTSTVRRVDGAAEGRQIQGLSGRTLCIPDGWVNPTGEWHVGLKALFELFPSTVKSRLQTKYKSKEWDPLHEALVTDAVRKLVEFDAKHLNLSDRDLDERFEQEELKARVDVLNGLKGKCSQAGPVCDCVVFNDGDSWCAVVDTTEEGRLADCTLLKPFRVSGQFSKFGEHDQVNYSINVYEEGNLLCIVTTGGAHGTHVASIVSAHFPENTERDGVAPGAQIVSIKIGDTRLSTMETSASLIRAAIVAVELKVDMINFSYGECSHWSNSGAVVEEFANLCNKHNIVFVSSAGNNGPALSTVGCPGGTTASLIGVGAFVSPDMMLGEYSLTHRKPGLPYTWTSRGPVADGGLGVTITAPGGAVTSVPNWTLRRKQLMNGTSMSSPNACGCIALMMSAFKVQGVVYSPASIKRSLSNTAIPLGSHDAFSVGHGVIQIDKAYEQYMENQAASINGVRFVVIASSKKGMRGIYLREPYQLKNVTRTSINVDAAFHEDASASEKLDFEMELALVSSCSWVIVPGHLCMWTGGRQFVVEVDPLSLQSGAHYAEVTAYDVSGKIKGALFRIPVTVIIPHKLTDERTGMFAASGIELKKADAPHRLFFHVPHHATWAAVKLSNSSPDRSRVTVQSIQLLQEQGFREHESCTTLSLEPGEEDELLFQVVDDVTLEVCLAPYWSDTRDAVLSVSIVFHSLHPSIKDLTFHAGTMWTTLDVVSSIGQESLAPEFKLTHHVVPKRPSENYIKPLGHRDILPDDRQIYELVLSYNFLVSRSSEVRPNAHLLSNMLYENPYGGQLWMLYDSNKQLLSVGDAYPKSYSVKLEKGDYVIRLQVRHHDRCQLECLKDMIILLEFKLSSAITLEAGPSRLDTLSTSCKFPSRNIHCGKVQPVYLSALSTDKLSKLASTSNSSELLVGRFTLSKDEGVKKKVNYPLQYVIGPKVTQKPKKPAKEAAGDGAKESGDAYANAEKEFKLQWLKSGALQPEELEKDYGDDVDFLFAKLKLAQENKQYDSLQPLVTKIMSKLDGNRILAHLGTKLDLSETSSTKSSEIDKARNILVETLLMEADVMLQQSYAMPTSQPHPRVKEVYVELCRFVDSKDSSMRTFVRKYAEARGHLATAFKLLMEEVGDKAPSKDSYKKLTGYLEGLNWDHCARNRSAWLLRKFPDNYQPF